MFPTVEQVRVALVMSLLAGAGADLLFAANPGDLDPTFSGDGVAIVAFDLLEDGRDEARAVAHFPNGSVALAGVTQSSDVLNVEYDLAAAKISASGTLDGTWGNYTGRTWLTFDGIGAPKDEQAYEVVVGTNDKVVAAGWRYDAGFKVVVFRLGATGLPDSTFTGDGKALLSVGGMASAVEVDSQDRIVLESFDPSSNGSTYLSRLAATSADDANAIDTSFGTLGVVTISGERPGDFLLLPDNRILVATNPNTSLANNHARLRRFTAAGLPDDSFGGGDGLAEEYFGTPDDRSQIQSLALDPQGRYVALGTFQTPSPSFVTSWILARFLPGGGLDETFGQLGVVELGTSIALGFDPRDAAVQSDGKIVVVGGDTSATIARYDQDGNLDVGFFSPFGSRSFAYQANTDISSAVSVATGPDGRIVAGGLSQDDTFFNRNFGVARFESGVVFCDGFEAEALYGESRWSSTAP